jgi:hypothetical protein
VSPTRHRVAGWVLGLIAAATALLAVVLVGLLWPYNSIRFPQGNVGTVKPSTVEQGGTIIVTWPAYCNDGVANTVNRFAEVLVEGRVVASFELPAVAFAGPPRATCLAPLDQSLTLPNYVVGQDNAPRTFRIRNEITYRPNAIRTVTVEAITVPFTIDPK